jgi:hypothetical protein
MIRQPWRPDQGNPASTPLAGALWGIIDGSIQPIHEDRKSMEAERINALSALLNDLTGREAELRRYL